MRMLGVLLVFSLAGVLGWWGTLAQGVNSDIIYSPNRQFRIPFNAGTNEANLKQLQLFYSTDQGRTWQPAAIAPPEQHHFRFLTDRDGYFWFTVQTTDKDNKLFPAVLDGAAPSLKVIIDTQAPNVALEALPTRNGEVGVSWTIRDDNLDLALPDSLKLEFRPPGSNAWLSLPINPGQTQYYWNPQTTGACTVRLKARDRAGNVGEAGATVSLGSGPSGQFQPASTENNSGLVPDRPSDSSAILPPDTERKLVNSKRISLNYDLKEVGPSGVSSVELWYTMDGRSWNKYPVKFGEDNAQRNVIFDVAGEGIYGLTLCAKSGVGLGERPPQIGDRPQIWIEVDLTKPQVQLQNVVVGNGPEKGKLTVNWLARDKNLVREPITLSFAEQSAGPWKTFAEKLPNSGRHTWQMPEQIPYQFYVRVEAIDKAGNIGEAITEGLVKVDLSNPKVQILNVEPAGK